MNNYDLCLHLAKCYYAGSDLEQDLEQVDLEDLYPSRFMGSEIAWFKVGHNASNDFYLGTDNEGKLYRCSYSGEYDFTLPYEECVKDIYISQIADANNIGYIGHW